MQIYNGKIKLEDENGRIILVDSATHALETVDYPHHEIHSGSHFFVDNFNDAANAGVQEFLITTPDTTKWAHFIYSVKNENESSITFFETVTTAAQGTTITPLNNNRNSATSATVLVQSYTSSITLTAGATILLQSRVGSGRTSGGAARSDSEIVLKQNTKYLFRIKNETANPNLLNWELSWYEHTNRD